MAITALFTRLSQRSRRLKMEMLRRYLALQGTERLLDVGSQVDSQTKLLERFTNHGNITAANIRPEHLAAIRRTYPRVHTVLADARCLPFRDREFDVVYSNAVIEHVGTLADQRRMADEVRRVGKRWFLTTPNRWYPFEFHVRMPFVSWLPPKLMHRAARLWGYDHVAGCYKRGNDYSDVHLLTATQLRAMFPDSVILKPRVTFWPETLVVVGPIGEVQHVAAARAALVPASAR